MKCARAHVLKCLFLWLKLFGDNSRIVITMHKMILLVASYCIISFFLHELQARIFRAYKYQTCEFSLYWHESYSTHQQLNQTKQTDSAVTWFCAWSDSYNLQYWTAPSPSIQFIIAAKEEHFKNLISSFIKRNTTEIWQLISCKKKYTTSVMCCFFSVCTLCR